MEGEKAHSAKALSLALAWVALLVMVGVNRVLGKQRRTPAGTAAKSMGRRSPGELVNGVHWLGVRPRCALAGTAPNVCRNRCPAGNHGHLLDLTDCHCRIPQPVRESFLTWKKSMTARVLTLVVGDVPGDLVEVSDEVFLVADLEPGSDAVGRVLSI